MLDLAYQQVPTDVGLARIKASGVKPIIAEAMEHHTIPTEEIKKLGVQIYLAKKVYISHVLHRDGMSLDLPIFSLLLQI
jgi:hypothetical protein